MTNFQEMKKHVQPYYQMFIGGEWLDGEDGEKIAAYCPANNEVLSTMAVASEKDVDAAVCAAEKAFETWQYSSIPERYNLLMQIYQRIMANIEPLAIQESLDTGISLGTARAFLQMGAELFPYFASLIRTEEDHVSSQDKDAFTMIVREPLGVVAAICPWNVPCVMTCYKLAPTIASANTLVLKPSSSTFVSSAEIIKLIADLLPKGVVNLINGGGSTTGQYLLDHPRINKFTFTGSTEIGKNVGLAAAEKIIPATLELGGKSVGIYFADVVPDKVEEAIGTIVGQCVFNCGQVCAMQSRVLIQESIYEEFVEKIAAALQQIPIGTPWDDNAVMGPLANKAQLKKVLDYIEIGKNEGARLVCGGTQLTEAEFSEGNFITPTLFADVNNQMRIAREEIFGPVIVAIPFKDEADAIAIANDNDYGLHGGVFSRDLAKAMRVAKGVRTGTMNINGYSGRSIGGAAFGGYKQSGLGREAYKTTLDHYSVLKTINYRID